MPFQRSSFLPDTFLGECGGTFKLTDGVYICDKCNRPSCTKDEEEPAWCYIAKPATPAYWLLHYGAEILSATQVTTRTPVLRNEDLPVNLRLEDYTPAEHIVNTKVAEGKPIGLYFRRRNQW